MSKRILIIEDEETYCRIWREIIWNLVVLRWKLQMMERLGLR